MHNVSDQRNRTKDMFSEKNICYDTANARRSSGLMKTRIVVSLPSAQHPANDRVNSTAPTGTVRHFLEETTKDSDSVRNLANSGTSRNLSSLNPEVNTPNTMLDPDVSIVKRPQKMPDVEGSGRGGIKVRKKESKKLSKGQSLAKRKRYGRGRKPPAFFRQETEFPLGDYDSVESLMTMDSVQIDSPGSAGGDDGISKAGNRESFLPRLSAGQRLPNLTENSSSAALAEAGSLAETESAIHRQESDPDRRTPMASLPAIPKASTRR